MPYLGNTPAVNFASVTKDTFSGNASTTAFTLSKPATTNGVAVYVENVRQIPTTAYAVSGTTLTFTGAPPSGTNNIYVMHHNTPVSTATHPAAQNLTAVNGTLTGTLGVTGASTLTGGITGDLDLNTDSAAIKFGADDDVTLTHVADQGLTLKSTATDGASGLGPILNLSTGDTDIASGNQLGTINFQAPDEGTGTDAQLVGASITAIAQADFSASVNSTSLLLRSSNSGTNDGGYLEVTNAGPIRMTKQPVFMAKFLGFQSGASATNPASNYQSPAINVGSHFNSSTGVFTAPVAGTYVFFGSLLSGNNSVVVRIYFEKNGSIDMGTQHEARTTEGYSGYKKQNNHAIITLAANDTVELVIYQDSTNTFYATNDSSYNSFSGYLIG